MLNLAEKHGEYALTCSADRIPYYRVVIATKRPGQFLVSQTADGIRIVAKNGKPSISGVFREAIENRAEWLLIENNKIQYYRNLATSLGVRLKQVRGQDVGSGKVVVRIIYPENAQP